MTEYKDAFTCRLEELETKLAFQDFTIEELNKVVVLLQQETAKLTDQLRVFSDRMKTLQFSNIASQSEETPPPHY